MDEYLDKIEAAPLAIVTKFGPWLTPLVPAFFVSRAIVEHLKAPPMWGYIAAAALEVVGIAATNSLLRAYQWEQERRVSDPPAPVWWNVAACVVYYATAFLMVFFVELWPPSIKLAPAAFIVLSGTSALVLALVGDQKRRERVVSQLSAKRSAKRSGSGQSGRSVGQPDHSMTGVNNPDTDRLQAGRKAKQKEAEHALLAFVTKNNDFTHNEAAAAVGRARSWVTGKLSEFEERGVIQKNGQEYKVMEEL